MSTPGMYMPQMPELRHGYSGNAADDFGLNSELFEQEWATFLARRQELYDNLQARMQLADSLAAAAGTDPEAMLPLAHAQMDQVFEEEQNRRTGGGWKDWLRRALFAPGASGPMNIFSMLANTDAPPGQNDRNDLIGIARFHGIPDPEKIPPDLLMEMIEERRMGWETERAAGGIAAGESPRISDLLIGGERSGALAFGTMKAITDVIQRIPFLGDALAKNRTVQQADQYINMVLEGLSVDLPEDRLQSFKILQGTGAAVGYTVMAYPVYQAALSIVPVPAIVNGKAIDTLGRAALRGALTAWALEGGGDDPILPAAEAWERMMQGDWKALAEIAETRGGKIGVGAVFGGLFDYALPNLARRVQQSFRARSTAERMAGRFGEEGPIIDAEYWMVGDAPELAPPVRQLGPGVDITPAPPRPGPEPLGPTALGPVGPAPLAPGPLALSPAGQAARGTVQQLENLGVQMGPSVYTDPVSSAVVLDQAGNVIGRGRTHPDAFRAAGIDPENLPDDVYFDATRFETQGGQIVTRDEARNIALANNQVRPEMRPVVEQGQMFVASDLAPREPLLLGTPQQNEIQALRNQLNRVTEQRNLAQRMAEMDPLTNLGNRTAMDRAMPAVSADENLAVVAFDADFFKAVNDNFGHTFGDEALLGFANAMSDAAQQLGIPERLFRPGGDEFVAIVPRNQAERFRELVEEGSTQIFRGTDPRTGNEITVETRLTGATGPDYEQADAALIGIKGGRRATREAEAMTPAEAGEEAIALSRQNQILESPISSELAAQPAFDETDVIQAVQQSSPTGVNIIRSVGDAGSVIRRLAEADQSIPIWGQPIPHPTNPNLTATFERAGTSFRLVVREADNVIEIVEDANLNRLMQSARNAQAFVGRGQDFWRDQGGFSTIRTRRIMPQHMRVAEVMRDGEMQQDLLISDGRPITNQMIEQYRLTGTFEGATVLTDSGYGGHVTGFTDEGFPLVVVENDPFGLPQVFHPDFLTTVNRSPMQGMGITELLDLQQTYDNFFMYVSERLPELVPIPVDDFEPEELFLAHPIQTQLPRLVDEYLDFNGVENANTRAAIRAGINHVYTQNLRALAPAEEQEIFQRALSSLRAANASAQRRTRPMDRVTRTNTRTGEKYEVPRPSLPQVQELAETMGFDYIPTAPPPLRYGANIAIREMGQDGLEVSVRVIDNQTGDYVGNLDGILSPWDGMFHVGYAEAFSAGGPRALGPRMIRDLGRQLIVTLRSRGHDIRGITGYRISGARVAARDDLAERMSNDPQTAYSEVDIMRAVNRLSMNTDPNMTIDADQMLRGVRTGGTLKHRFSDLEVPVDSDEAALEFLKNFEGDLPDITPVTDFPADVIPLVAGMDNPGHSLSPVWEDGLGQYYDYAESFTDRLEHEVDDIFGRSTAEEELFPPGPGDMPDRFSDRFVPPGSPPPPPPPVRRGGFQPGPGRPPGGGLPGTEVASETLGQQFRQVARNDPAALGALLRRQESAWLHFMEPIRHRFLQLEDELRELGIDQGQIWRQYSEMTTAVDKAHNEANPWHQEWSDIVTRFRRKYRRDGTVVRIEEIPNWNDKLRAMEEAGYTPAEMEAQRMIRPFFDRLHGTAGISHYIFDYIPHLRQRQGMNGIEDPFEGTETSLPRELRFFAEHVRAGNVDMRQLDIGTLGALWIRGWQFKKHVGPIWEEMHAAWSDPRVPERLRNLVLDWMHVVRVGHDPKEEVAVAGVRQVLNNLGIPITSSEVAGLWNGLLSNTYRSLLGGRPDVIFRDSIQPLLTWARVGGDLGTMRQVYLDYFRNPEARGQMIQRAEEMGTVVRGMVQTAYSEAFTQRAQTTEGFPVFSPAEERRRAAAARVMDVLYDLVPRRFRGGIQGTYADPLLAYTKLGEFNRIVSGEYGFRIADRALQQYYAGEIDMAQLMGQSRARVYPRPIQTEFQRLVQAGNRQGAASLLANEAANLQFRYGSREAPIASRNVPGRLTMMFGTFSQQFLAYMKEALSHGTFGDRAGFAARYAAILATIGAAGAYTGWRFSKWMWHNSLTFAGGPIVGFLAEAATAWSGVAAQLEGRDPLPREVAAMRQMTPENIVGGLAETVFPYSGALRTLQRAGDVLGPDAPFQGERALQLLLTGEATWAPIYEREFRNEVQPTTPDFSQPMQFAPRQWTPLQGTGGFPQPQAAVPSPATAPGAPPQYSAWDTLATPEVQVMLEALRTTPRSQWRQRMEGAGYETPIVEQVIRAGAGAQQ